MNDDFRPHPDDRIGYEDRPRRRKLKLLALMILAGFAATVWYAFQQGQSAGGGDAVPVIQAESDPFKTRPDNPGGMEIPNQDKLVYGELAGVDTDRVTERLMPPQEQPMIGEAANLAEQTQTPEASLELQQSAETKIEPLIMPEQPLEQEVAVRPTPEIQSEQAKKPENKSTKLAALTQKDADKPAQKAASAKGLYKIQLASLPEKSKADQAAANFKKKYSALVEGYSVSVKKADIPKKGVFYRVQVEGYATRDAAGNACEKFKSQGQGCIIVSE